MSSNAWCGCRYMATSWWRQTSSVACRWPVFGLFEDSCSSGCHPEVQAAGHSLRKTALGSVFTWRQTAIDNLMARNAAFEHSSFQPSEAGVFYSPYQAINQSVAGDAADSPLCQFKEKNRRRGHRLWLGREW